MKTINVHDAKTRLSVLLAEIERGSKGVVICRNGKPVADLVPHHREVSMTRDRNLGALRIKYDPIEEVSQADWPADER